MIPDAWRRGGVAVIGLGRSGVAVSQWLAARGLRVYASDTGTAPGLETAAAVLRAQGVTVELGRHDVARIARAAAVVVSPGVRPDAPALVAARDAGVDVVAELDVAARALERTRLVAVTGTNGKSTTTALIARLLTAGGARAVAAGNIGRPLIDVAADESTRYEWVAVEASSFQLHDAPHFAPTVGVVTNLAPDHLDRYVDVDAYYADKQLLFRNASPSSVWVLNADDDAVVALADGVPGVRRLFSLARRADAWFDRARSALVLEGEVLLSRERLRLLGDHNVANALAAALAADAAGAGRRALAEGLASFEPLAHRLEPVGERDGVLWVNDSKATNVASARAALAAMSQPYVLVLGGRGKGEAFDVLAPLLDDRCRAVVAYGEARERIVRDLAGVAVTPVEQFDDAVTHAARLAGPGDVLLLTPACASFDQFRDYEERGARFRALVEAP